MWTGINGGYDDGTFIYSGSEERPIRYPVVKATDLPVLMARTVCLLLLGCLLSLSMATTLDSLVRRNTPRGHTFSAFVEICESCGEYFGNSLSYRCIMDRSLATFRQCNTAVVSVNRRR